MPQSRSLVWKIRQGRISRLTYLKGLFLAIICAVILAIVLGLIFVVVQIGYETPGGAPQQGALFDATSVLAAALPSLIADAIVICLFVICIILTIKRLHDLGHSGWLSLISLIPFLNLLLLGFLLFKVSEPSSNRFGPPPG